jgi:hypothetical protein
LTPQRYNAFTVAAKVKERKYLFFYFSFFS